MLNQHQQQSDHLSALFVAAFVRCRMKNIVDKHSPKMTQTYFEKGYGDTPERLVFAYRLTTDKKRYVQQVVSSVLEKVEHTKSIEVNLVCVKGIPEAYATILRDEVVTCLSEKETEIGDVFIDMQVYVDVSIEIIQELEKETIYETPGT